jgi:hypothetical protein
MAVPREIVLTSLIRNTKDFLTGIIDIAFGFAAARRDGA